MQWLALRGTCPVCRAGLGAHNVQLLSGAPLDVPLPPKPDDPPPGELLPGVTQPLSSDEVTCLWLTFVLGFLCGISWLCVPPHCLPLSRHAHATATAPCSIGVCSFGRRARGDKRWRVRLPWVGNIAGTLLLCIALIFGFVWLIWPH